MARNAWLGHALGRSEIAELKVRRVVPGARYAVKARNRPSVVVFAEPGETITALTGRLVDGLVGQGLSRVGTGSSQVAGPLGEPIDLRAESPPIAYFEMATQGVLPTDAQFLVTLPSGANGGEWSLSIAVDGAPAETTADIAESATTAEIAAAIEASVDTVATVRLVGTWPKRWSISFGGAIAGKPVVMTAAGALLEGTARVDIAKTQGAADGSPEVQALWFPGFPIASGNQRIRFLRNGVYSDWVAPINAINTSSAIAPQVQAAIDSLVGPGVATSTVFYNNIMGVVVIKWISTGAQEQIVIESQYDFVSAPGTWYSYGGSLAPRSEKIREGGTNNHEILLVDTGGAPVAIPPESYDVTFNGNTQSFIRGSSSVQTGWTALHADAVTYGWGSHVMYIVRIGENADQPAVTGTFDGYATVISNGSPPANTIISVVIHADDGVLNFATAEAPTTWTSDLARDLSSSALDTALEGLYGSGNITVTGSGTPAVPFQVEFGGALAGDTIAPPVVDITGLIGGFSPSVTRTTTPALGVSQQARLLVDPYLTGGWMIPFLGSGHAPRIAYNGNAAAWQSSLESIYGSGAVVVSGAAPEYVVDWQGAQAERPVALPIIDCSLLTASESWLLKADRLKMATGVSWWNDPDNWSLGVVPWDLDDVELVDGATPILYGLRQRATFSVAAGETEVLTAGEWADGQKLLVTLSSGASITVGGSSSTLASGTAVYVQSWDPLAGTATLSLSADGLPIVWVDATTGTLSIRITITQHDRSRSPIGLPRRTNTGWREEGLRSLMVDLQASDTHNLIVGYGDPGSGSGRLSFDFGTSLMKALILSTGARLDADGRALRLLNVNSSSEVDQREGTVEVATEEGQSATFKSWRQTGGELVLGTVTLSAIDSTGGEFTAVNVTMNSGTMRRRS